jgi:hypothetical protein
VTLPAGRTFIALYDTRDEELLDSFPTWSDAPAATKPELSQQSGFFVEENLFDLLLLCQSVYIQLRYIFLLRLYHE